MNDKRLSLPEPLQAGLDRVQVGLSVGPGIGRIEVESVQRNAPDRQAEGLVRFVQVRILAGSGRR